MARTSTTARSTKRSTRVHARAPAAALEQVPATDQGDLWGMQWARDATDAWLMHARGLFDIAQTLQQAQVRALHDAVSDFETAVDALDEAEDLAAVSAVPGRLLQAQWQHAVNNTWSATQRVMEMESAWLQQAQAQQVQRMADLATEVTMSPPAFQLPIAQAGSAAAEAVTAQLPAEWRKWAEQWQHGAEQMSRRWSEAVK